MQLVPPLNFSLAIERLAEAKRERAEERQLRMRELELLEQANPGATVSFTAAGIEHFKSRDELNKRLYEHKEFEELKQWDWRTELLDVDPRWAVYRVLRRSEPGRVCSRCRYMSGCDRCDPHKALRHHLVKQGFILAGLLAD